VAVLRLELDPDQLAGAGSASPPMLTDLLTRPAERHRYEEGQAGTALRQPYCWAAPQHLECHQPTQGLRNLGPGAE
jgi:hypothetical protein